MTEHRVIERMLAILKRQLVRIAADGDIDVDLIDVATDFIRTYADRCHHGKEEEILFRRLAEKPLDDKLAAMMAELIEDHVLGRDLTRRLAEANALCRVGDKAAMRDIETCIRELVEFYPAHIEKEDRHFFKPCLKYFDAAEIEALLVDFDKFDRSLIHEKYRGIVRTLENAAI